MFIGSSCIIFHNVVQIYKEYTNFYYSLKVIYPKLFLPLLHTNSNRYYKKNKVSLIKYQRHY